MDLGLKALMLPDLVALRRLHGANFGLRQPEARAVYAQVLKAGLDRRRSRNASQ
jgi:hypothetical protein